MRKMFGRLAAALAALAMTSALAASLNHAAASAGIVLAELHVRRPTLESTYLRLLEGDPR